jgi:uncharacterized protein YjlB
MKTEEITFPRSDWVPNNQKLPVLLYKAALQGTNVADEFERLFSENGWQGIWRNGVFDYHHYHSGAHEVLGVGRGNAKLTIGGPTGREIEVSAGDCIVLPAGTGHKNLGASPNFLVVGAYPPGQHADIQRAAPTKEQLAKIAAVALPNSDPVQGAKGYLLEVWG